MDTTPTRPTRVRENLLAGPYLWRSNPEDPGVLVMVTYEEGTAVAYVQDGEDAGEVLNVKDMGGTFTPARKAPTGKE